LFRDTSTEEQLTTHSPQADGLSLIPWAEIREEWDAAKYTAARAAVSALAGDAAGDDIHALLFAQERPDQTEVVSVLRGTFERAASASPDGELLVALYVYGLCLEKWEKSEAYCQIRVILDALGDVYPEPAVDGADAPTRLLSILARQTRLLDYEMGVEEAMNCSCPVAMGERARKVVDGLQPLIAELDGTLSADDALAGDLAELRDVVRADAQLSHVYFAELAAVADAVLRFVDPAAGGSPDFEGVLAGLEQAESNDALEGEVYVSELRAHGASLQALRDNADEPQLRIDAAEIVYLYPFALDGVAATAAVERTLRGDATTALGAAGLGPAYHQSLALNDLWDRADRDEPGYSGASIELPKITVETTAHDWIEDHYPGYDPLLSFSVEVRLSRLGNHYLRVTSEIAEAGLHEVNQALRRGSRAMGAERVSSEGHPTTWEKIADYADEVIATIAGALQGTPVRNLNAPSHVVLGARSISVESTDGPASPASAETLEKSVGATLLFHPVRHLATSLEEWVRYPPPDVTNLLAQQGYVRELVVRTDNTTVLFMPESPEWLIDEYEEMVEFVASVPPLLTLWEQEGLGFDKRLETMLRSKGVPVRELHAHELEILEHERGIREQLAFLHSQALCRTRGQRRFLNELWEAAGLPALEGELEEGLTRLAERQARIAALIRRADQEHSARLSGRVQLVLALIAAASLAGVLQWATGAYDLDGRPWAIMQALILGAASALVVIAVAVWTRGS
jgi:hypothetical protein